jgi:hypothetical protein
VPEATGINRGSHLLIEGLFENNDGRFDFGGEKNDRLVYIQKVAGYSRRTLPLKIPAGLGRSLPLHRRTNNPKLSTPLVQFFGARLSLLNLFGNRRFSGIKG